MTESFFTDEEKKMMDASTEQLRQVNRMLERRRMQTLHYPKKQPALKSELLVELEAIIESAMAQFGPDGHTDGSTIIASEVLNFFIDKGIIT